MPANGKRKIIKICILCGAIIFILAGVAGAVRLYHRNLAPKYDPNDGIYESKFKYADEISAGVLYPVAHVIDGDTLIVRAAGMSAGIGEKTDEVTIRLIGIDTPETVDPRKAVQCFGPEASAEAKRLLASTSVYLEKDSLKGDYDKYGRVLAYVNMGDGSSYNEYMLQNGFAREYTYLNQPYKYQSEFKADEATAKKARAGLWSKCIN